MGLFKWSFPERLVREIKKTIAIDNFVETGTYHGEGAKKAATIIKNVHTIELSEKYYNLAKAKGGNINYYLGSSLDRLPEIIQKLQGTTVFWLDAHFCWGDTAGEEFKCPLIPELKIVNTLGSDSIILIDDARFHLSSVHLGDRFMLDYPRIDEVIKVLDEVPGRYISIVADIIIVVPYSLKEVIDKFCYEHYSFIGYNINERYAVINNLPKIVWRVLRRLFSK